ncbi:hypothetical protein [Streptomyces chartreusis]|uniref:hypothetical protein n=1 Tax=Streptomyces chartreusis TaxID=1969 RepID=UPI0033F306A1
MTSLREEIVERCNGGEFRERLRQYCLSWKRFRTPYSLANVIRQAVEDDRADDLYNTLLDEEFRKLRTSLFGLNELRSDLYVGRDYFSRCRPDLVRYLQIMFAEPASATDERDFLRYHQRNCEEFAEFLQLDVMPHERHDIGIHRTLRRLFPVTHGSITIKLAGYELGEWDCACGTLTGISRRYEYDCPCGALKGNGRLESSPPTCTECQTIPDYLTCSECGTRVTLANIRRLRLGGAPLSVYRVPLYLNLEIERLGRNSESARCLLINLPLPLGLREIGGSIEFGLPDLLWLSEFSQQGDPFYVSSNLFGLKESVRYDSQTKLAEALAAAFRRTLWGRSRGRRRQFGKTILAALAQEGRTDALPVDEYTRGFEHRLGQHLCLPERGPQDLLKYLDVSADCLVATSPHLQGSAVLVNRRLADPAALCAPYLVRLRAQLGQEDILTQKPPGVAAYRASELDQGGIVPPGSLIQPGQVLVGIATPAAPEVDITAEQRLLRVIFGDDPPTHKDKSLVMIGEVPGRVIAEHVGINTLQAGDLPKAAGRVVESDDDLREWEAARITMTLVVDQPLEAGDALFSDQGPPAVVCGIAGAATVKKLAGTEVEPDVLVAPDHPWAPHADGPSAHILRLRVKKSDLVGREATARATGPYTLVDQLPVTAGSAGHPHAQLLHPEHYYWLIRHGARHLALELYGARCDCVDWREPLYRSLLMTGSGPSEPPGSQARTWTSLGDSPSEAMRRLEFVLRSARLRSWIDEGRISLTLMTDAEVLSASHGAVTTEENHWFTSGHPASLGGLHCERIFGPIEDWKCACGQLLGQKHEGTVCGDCGVEVASRMVRRHRMGHIELPVPIVHGWYLRGPIGNRVAKLLHVKKTDLVRIAMCDLHVVAESRSSWPRRGQVLDWGEYSTLRRGPDNETVMVTGGEAFEVLIEQAIESRQAPPHLKHIVMRRLPVLPPGWRPDVLVEGGPFLTTDLTELYRAIVRQANTLRRLMDMGAVEDMILYGRGLLQQAIERLLDNARHPRPRRGEQGRVLRSLTDKITLTSDPQAPLRADFLRRPAEYSARTRVVTGDTPGPDTVLLPAQLAYGLFKPVIIHALVEEGIVSNVKAARSKVEARAVETLPILKKICSQMLVLLSFASSPWPLVAVKVRLTRYRALRVHPDLLDRVGWVNLGADVQVFGIMTPPAANEAAALLTPDRLLGAIPAAECGPFESLFDLAQGQAVDEFSGAALSGRSFYLAPEDGLLLCDPQWVQY